MRNLVRLKRGPHVAEIKIKISVALIGSFTSVKIVLIILINVSWYNNQYMGIMYGYICMLKGKFFHFLLIRNEQKYLNFNKIKISMVF